MLYRSSIGAVALIAALSVVMVGVQAHDESKYPDWSGQWVRIGSGSFDPTKRPGLGQQAPLTPEYQAVLEASLADQAQGGQGNDPTVKCISGGMPRAMIVTQPMEVVITPKTTYVMLELHGMLRRIYTDGRDWPKEIEPAWQGYSLGKWIDTDGDGRYDAIEIETRHIKGRRAYDATGLPLHDDNKTVVTERISLDKANRNVLRNEITVIDNALTRPWSVVKTYRRDPDQFPIWREYLCSEDNGHIAIGNDNYFISADGHLMPSKKGQAPPDLRNFNQPQQ